MPVEEYLRAAFPGVDCEYRDGEVLERSMPDYLHSPTQGLLVGFYSTSPEACPNVCPEIRMKLHEDLYLIPDVAIFHLLKPALIPDLPPLIAIEILSPDDLHSAVRGRLQEYRDWGVRHVWLVDPNPAGSTPMIPG